MTMKSERATAIDETIAGIRAIMETGPTIENLERSKALLIDLAQRRELFDFEHFPLPSDDAMECSYLLHEYADGSYSLYVNSGAAHQYYGPHDHGDTWAIIAGVRGRERHKLYLKRQAVGPDDCLLEKKGEIVVAPGTAVTMQPDGIHEVNALDDQPLLHLHLYARNFELQGERWKYDLERNQALAFSLDELGSITDAR